MTTIMPTLHADNGSQADDYLPAITLQNGELALERGLHQEIGWERQTDESGMSVVLFADNIRNPVIDAASRIAAGHPFPSSTSLLYDRASGMSQIAGPEFATTGMMAVVEHCLPGGNHVRVSY